MNRAGLTTALRPPAGQPAGDLHWRDRAACADQPPELFDPIPGSKDRPARPHPDAISTCNRCPVTAECLTDAIRTGVHDTVRAGQVIGGSPTTWRPPATCTVCGRPAARRATICGRTNCRTINRQRRKAAARHIPNPADLTGRARTPDGRFV